MGYASISEMVNSGSLRSRLVACAAAEQISNPEQWTASNIYQLCAAIGDDDWAFATATRNPNFNPDTGARNDVVTDAQILTAVEAIQALP